MSGIFFNYPLWFLLICGVVAISYSLILYWKNRLDDFSLYQIRILSALRFIVVFLICFLLLSPVFQQDITFTEDPIIVLLHDNSESVIKSDVLNIDLNAYMKEKEELLEALGHDFTISKYVFGESFRPKDSLCFSDQVTDMSDAFLGLRNYFSNRNVGAVIMASDGIFNRGQNPIYLARENQFPIYTIALGDTVIRQDLIINRVSHNAITYLGNVFPVEVVVEARKSEGMSSKLTVMKNGEVIDNKILNFSSSHDFVTELFELEANEVGTQKYEVGIGVLEGEVNVDNNSQMLYIDVIDSRQKVLLLSDSPHPDIGAIKLSLEDNENYEIDHFQINRFNGNLEAYNLIIFHQLPSNRFSSNRYIREALSSDVPILFIVGPLTNINALNNISTGINIRQRSGQFNQTQPVINYDFSTFSIGQSIESMIPLMPPLYTPFASFQVSPATNILFYQKIGNVETQNPLIAFSEISEKKHGIILGEGIWRWRLNDFLRNNNHRFFNELVSRIVQYMAVKEDKRPFRVITKSIIYENEPLIFEAELYNASYELVNEPAVNLSVINDEGVEFLYEFGRTSNAYVLNIGTLPPGSYYYKAQTALNRELYVAEGEIIIAPLNLESLNTVADHGLLYRISSETDAKMVYPGSLSALADELKERKDISGIIYSQKEYSELIKWKWIFFLILALLSAEWFIRKRAGNY